MLEEVVHPLVEHDLLSFAKNVETIVVAGRETFTKNPLRLVPIGCVR
jgi:hypothetical protein